MIRKRSFKKIICVNRHGGNLEKQRKIHKSRGLTSDLSNVQFLEANLADRNLGLSNQQYLVLVSEATHIFHGAWQVNFNLPMSSFRSQLDGCYRLVELASRCTKRVAITFISSVGAANHWAYKYDGSVPERALSDFAVAEPMGYAQSKLLAELLFSDANKRLGVPVTVCRVGQIAGPVQSEHGAWNSSEWFSSLILSAKALEMLPGTLGAMDRIDWLPVDLLGDMLVETISRKRAIVSTTDCSSDGGVPVPPAEFLHFVNPHHVEWSDVVSELASHMTSRPRVVSYDTWLQTLTGASEQHADEVEDVPAIKLLDFFQDIGRCDAKRPTFSTNMTEQACPNLRNGGPVSVDWILLWMKQWGVDIEGGTSGTTVASKPLQLDFPGQALPETLKASDFSTYSHQKDSGLGAMPVAPESTRSASTVPTVWESSIKDGKLKLSSRQSTATAVPKTSDFFTFTHQKGTLVRDAQSQHLSSHSTIAPVPAVWRDDFKDPHWERFKTAEFFTCTHERDSGIAGTHSSLSPSSSSLAQISPDGPGIDEACTSMQRKDSGVEDLQFDSYEVPLHSTVAAVPTVWQS